MTKNRIDIKEELLNDLESVGNRLELMNSEINDISEMSNRLKELGINVYNDNNSYRTIKEVINDISNVWDIILEEERTHVAHCISDIYLTLYRM